MTFVRTTKGAINTDRITGAYEERDGRVALVALDTVPTGYYAGTLDEFLYDAAPVLPATGFVWWIMCAHTGERPVAADIEAQRVPLLGWRVLPDEALPVVPFRTHGTEWFFLEEPGGLREIGGDTCDAVDLATARAAMLVRAQENWAWQQKRQA